jgi:hypothetical protein
MKKNYYRFRSHKLDIVGLQFCAMNLGSGFFPIFKKNYFKSSPREGKRILKEGLGSILNGFIDQKSAENACKFHKDFFLVLTEVLTNQSYVAYIVDCLVSNIQQQHPKSRSELNTKMEEFKEIKRRKMVNTLAGLGVRDSLSHKNILMKDCKLVSTFRETLELTADMRKSLKSFVI